MRYFKGKSCALLQLHENTKTFYRNDFFASCNLSYLLNYTTVCILLLYYLRLQQLRSSSSTKKESSLGSGDGLPPLAKEEGQLYAITTTTIWLPE
jgi:hypothetical protein